MTKKGAGKKGQALSLHDFITNTPGALPLAACLPSRHGEVSKWVQGPRVCPMRAAHKLQSAAHKLRPLSCVHTL